MMCCARRSRVDRLFDAVLCLWRPHARRLIARKKRSHRLLTDLIVHHELADLRPQALDLGLILRILIFAVDLERLDAGLMIFLGPLAVLALGEAVLTGGLGNRDLALHDLDDDRGFTLRGPPLDRFRFGSRLVGHLTPS